MPYISETALRSVKLNQKILTQQHMGVNQFTAYPVTEKEYVHYVACCLNQLKKHRFSSSPIDIQIQQ